LVLDGITRVDQLRLEVRSLRAEVRELRAALEAVHAAGNGRRDQGSPTTLKASRPRYTSIPQARSDARHNLWSEYFFLKQAEVTGKVYDRKRGAHPPTSKTYFAEHVRIDGRRLSTREFQRWFQRVNTHREGSTQDVRIRAAIESEIARLRTAGYRITACPTGRTDIPVSIRPAPGYDCEHGRRHSSAANG